MLKQTVAHLSAENSTDSCNVRLGLAENSATGGAIARDCDLSTDPWMFELDLVGMNTSVWLGFESGPWSMFKGIPGNHSASVWHSKSFDLMLVACFRSCSKDIDWWCLLCTHSMPRQLCPRCLWQFSQSPTQNPSGSQVMRHAHFVTRIILSAIEAGLLSSNTAPWNGSDIPACERLTRLISSSVIGVPTWHWRWHKQPGSATSLPSLTMSQSSFKKRCQQQPTCLEIWERWWCKDHSSWLRLPPMWNWTKRRGRATLSWIADLSSLLTDLFSHVHLRAK